MSYSVKRMKVSIHNLIINCMLYGNMASLVYWVSLIDYISSWQPLAIMILNIGWLLLIGYANKERINE